METQKHRLDTDSFDLARRSALVAGLGIMKALLAVLALVGVVCAEDFTLTDGTEYKGARVSRVDPDGLVLTLVDGIAKVPFAKLSPALQKQYNYDPEAAQQFAAEKASKAAVASKQMQAQEAERQRQAADKKAVETLLASAIQAHLTISQITDDGFLAHGYVTETNGSNQKLQDDIYVVGPNEGLVDNAKIQAVIVPIGTKKFTTVLGAERTVAKFKLVSVGEADSPEPSRRGVSSTQRIGGG